MSKKEEPPISDACQPADRNPPPIPPVQPDAVPLPDEQHPTDARSHQREGGQTATSDGGFSAPYEVGYKKPPRSGCFKKDQRANPKGRPKASRDPAEIILAEAFKEIRVRDNGRVRKVSKIEVGMHKAMNSFAETGDFKAALPFLKLLVSRHHMLNEPVGQRLGQCCDGELLLVAENRADSTQGLQDEG